MGAAAFGGHLGTVLVICDPLGCGLLGVFDAHVVGSSGIEAAERLVGGLADAAYDPFDFRAEGLCLHSDHEEETAALLIADFRLTFQGEGGTADDLIRQLGAPRVGVAHMPFRCASAARGSWPSWVCGHGLEVEIRAGGGSCPFRQGPEGS